MNKTILIAGICAVAVILLFIFTEPLFKGKSYEIGGNDLTNETVLDTSSSELTVPEATSTLKTFNVLIVLGHDSLTGGAHFKDIYERDLVSDISEKISVDLNSRVGYKAVVSRDKKEWNPLFTEYFKNEEQNILDFKNLHQAEEKKKLSSGSKKFVLDMANHTNVDKATAVKLYGINKWANDNEIDLVIHLHFNDSERPNENSPGEYKGFTIFIPESQAINATSSRMVAEFIYAELGKILTPEVVGNQKTSIIEDQSLIALGASGTLTKPSLLIEYAYIYEKMLRTDEERAKSIDEMAKRTTQGIINYVDNLKK
ncbi:MAG: N-acetylmuramoyl-L-alanine amidase [Candidatus Taylorbacteria bacterium]|nr:N-acetylmuramoyl-L-alanine amidase [Candidatus Taylorbacteria bacterium]